MLLPPALRIENLAAAHLDELATVLLHPAVCEHIEDELPSLDEFKLGLERAIAGPAGSAMDETWLHYLVRDVEGTMLGRPEATVHHGIAEVAFVFGHRHWGRGYATAGLRWLHDELARNHAVKACWATTTPANYRSQALLRRCAYVPAALPECPLYSYAPGDLVFRR
ncbi:GNAT family N-acetyltransferase [Duganella radicis]|uniref:GNAT family N-acetyltransferase n=1 Tax=Duganella radicis TaxID=551988 RepID=A0A6L6PKW5_9BURK|nr:GNAT family N-acetyltransferase [Duganella radicis]MTV39593.1 GNAT family N-acetyltransferase [Duganella radicis]